MMSDVLNATAEKLVACCRENRTIEGLDELYAPDAVSVEAMLQPGSESREISGVEGIRGKHEWWDASFEVHSAEVSDPFPHGDDRFAVIFRIDTTHKESNSRSKMEEIGVYTVNDSGKIIREEFFYSC